jgi:putative alpha-1,2-mannosidase
MIIETKYKPTPDGLSGNDDLGQMSAWYIFSALGFYPVAPGSEFYELGSPLIKSATINLENGKTFKIRAVNQSPDNKYVLKAKLNGQDIINNKISHFDIMAGGELVFYMGARSRWSIKHY